MPSMLALVDSLWLPFVVLLQSIDWASLAAWLAVSGLMALVARLWQSRGLWGAKVPFLAAAFELLDVFGFSPSLLAQWLQRRSWYRSGQREGDRIRRLFPHACVVAVCFSCSGSQLPEGLSCPLPDVRKATLPAAVSLAKYVLTLASSSCGDSCPPELASARKVVDQTGATAKDVCQAIPAVKLVPCEQCADRLDAVSSLLGCESLP
jgi:hypothetical protein